MLASLSVDRFLSDKPLAITLAGLEELRGHIMGRLVLFDSNPKALFATLAEEIRTSPSKGRPRSGNVGVIPIRGTITQHAAGDLSSLLFGGATTEEISASLKEFLADDSIASIILDIDSPGGTTYGLAELADQIREARTVKPIVAYAHDKAASAAYWLGSQADQFYAAQGSMVGSIGVYGIHEDVSKALDNEGVKVSLISAGKHKVDGNPFEPLPDDVRERMQARVDDAYDQFVLAVAKGRGITPAAVKSGYGEGDVMTSKQAKAAGMIDGILSWDQVVQKSRQLRPVANSGNAAEAQGLMFSEHAEQVLADLQVFFVRAKSLADTRAEDGRQLSAERRETIFSIIDETKVAIQQVELVVSRPVDEEALARLGRIRLRRLQSEAALLVPL